MNSKAYEINPLVCPKCQDRMSIITFLTDLSLVERIINCLKLTFVAAKPTPARIAFQEFLIAAERLG